MYRRLIPFVLLFLVVSCATPYQKFELFGRGGYKDIKISEDTYKVVYFASQITSHERFKALLLYRSAELTINSGYGYFEVLSNDRGEDLTFGTKYGFLSENQIIKMLKDEPDERNEQIYTAQKVLNELKATVNP